MEEIGLTGKELKQFINIVSQDYGRLAYALIAEPDLKITPITSRAGGLPYWDFSQEYPRDEEGNALCFLCQINLAEVAAIKLNKKLKALREMWGHELPEKGLLQFFALNQGSYGCTFSPDNPQCRVVYLPEVEHDQELSMEALKERLLGQGLKIEEISNIGLDDPNCEQWPIQGETALRLRAVSSLPWQSGDIDNILEVIRESLNEFFKDLTFQGVVIESFLDESDVLEEILESPNEIDYTRGFSELERVRTLGHFLGYPNFIQETPLYNPEWVRFNAVLLCLDKAYYKPDGSFKMCWGDHGVADFLINQQKLREKDFSDIFYTWECY